MVGGELDPAVGIDAAGPDPTHHLVGVGRDPRGVGQQVAPGSTRVGPTSSSRPTTPSTLASSTVSAVRIFVTDAQSVCLAVVDHVDHPVRPDHRDRRRPDRPVGDLRLQIHRTPSLPVGHRAVAPGECASIAPVVDIGDGKRIALLDDTAIERDPLLDVALGPALLAAVAADGGPDRLRLYRPGPTLAFSGRDCATPGIGAAAAAARAPDSLRCAGAPVVGPPPITAAPCAWTTSAPTRGGHGRDPRPVHGFGELLVGALRGLGVDARLGPVPGEYCPGISASTTATATSWSAPRNAWSAGPGCSAPSSWLPMPDRGRPSARRRLPRAPARLGSTNRRSGRRHRARGERAGHPQCRPRRVHRADRFDVGRGRAAGAGEGSRTTRPSSASDGRPAASERNHVTPTTWRQAGGPRGASPTWGDQRGRCPTRPVRQGRRVIVRYEPTRGARWWWREQLIVAVVVPVALGLGRPRAVSPSARRSQRHRRWGSACTRPSWSAVRR